jgi:FdhD protein
VLRRSERESAWAAAPAKQAADPRVLAAPGHAQRTAPFSPMMTPTPEPENVRAFNFHPAIDDLPEEQTIGIEINGRPVASVICSPVAAREMAVGWAFTNGYFSCPEDLQRITDYPGRISIMVEDPSRGGVAWSSFLMGAGASAPDLEMELQPVDSSPPISVVLMDEDERERRWRISKERFLGIVARVFNRIENDRCAGGYHHAAAADDEGVCIIGRDICRQNAVDKIVGWTVLERRSRDSLILCLSGRITADIAHKAWRAGFPVVASQSLPTADAVDFAEVVGITVVGRALDARRSVYSHAWRLTEDE